MITNIHFLPICIFILIPSSFILTYCIAVYLKHVAFEFPYISDTGTYEPESCIFSLAVNFIAFLVTCLFYVRYKHIEQHYRDHLSSEYAVVLKLNRSALFVGMLGCFGACLIANFQVTNVIYVHMTGALILCGCATIYCWLQTIISHYVCPFLNSVLVARLRVLLSLIMTVTFATTLVAGIVAHKNFHGKDATKWRPEDGGFRAHVFSTAAEWILIIAFDTFILTFAREMQKISLSSPMVLFLSEDVTLQSSEFYNSQEQVHIAPSPNSLHISSLPSSPYGDFNKGNSVLTTQAVVH